MKFYNIGQLSDVFDYITNTLVPTVFVTQDQNGVDLPIEDWARIALFNKALGGVLIEVYSKSTTECPADGSLYKLYPTCHEYQGLDSEYNSYLLDFSVDPNDTLASLAEWKTKNWIDASTGEVLISVVTYNGELEGYVVTKLTLEFHLGGFITPKASFTPTISIPDFQDSLWSLSDSTSPGSGSTDDALTKKGLNTAINTLWDIAYYTAALRVIGAVVIALIGLQILDRFHFHPQLNILTRTVANALRQFRSFFVVFFVIFSSFTIIGCMIFGDRAKEFSSLDNAMASCINVLFNAFDFDSIKDLRFSVAFYWIYMIVVSLVLMNMMLAIVLDAYEQVSSDSYKLEVSVSLSSRIQTICWDLLFELQFLYPDQDIAVSRGKIRSRLLEMVLKEKMKDTSIESLTPQTLRNLFPKTDIRDEEIVATLHFIEHGIAVQKVLTANETQLNEK
ncbi:hypothetical protein BBJ29_000197 [Phytophthora kernoviae]|uniref:Polycystin cation channel PKD1/PKD2 domain-containing protein n=1 Tax=Phytophthora kernoviae TaxID=325452 RepID=A0A3F2S3L1_9STRA|nr:hypothetical protein BBJ29_000197 [Phytophthora kernoviae]RLN69509.1 hypothetical protein BBP00_00000332 [Phytophthora kernoviae]